MRFLKHIAIVLLIVLAGVAVYAYRLRTTVDARTAPPDSGNSNKKKGGRGGDGGATPVVAVRARKGNIGVYFAGLGTVTPIYTVTVRSRVDGELMNVLYREGDMVKKGDTLIEIDPRPYQAALTQYEGQLLKDQAALDNARIDLTRYETLLKQNAIPEQQLATQKATVTQDEGTVKSDQGQIDNAKLNLTYSKITAPITGRVGLRLVDPGNIVHAADSNGLVVITQIDPISVLFTLAEDQLPEVMKRVNAGQMLPVEAFDRDMKNKIAQGTLETIDNQIDQTTGTVRIRANFDNKSGSLFPNQFVNARLRVQEKRNVILLDSAAIQRTSNSAYVYLVQPNSTVTMRTIMLGTTEGNDTEITSGLNEGDEVVMMGADKLDEGSKVVATVQGEQPRGGKK